MGQLKVRIDTAKFDRLMVAHGLNVTTLAKRIGVSRTTVSNARNGYGMPRTSTLAKMCDVLECEPVDIIKAVD